MAKHIAAPILPTAMEWFLAEYLAAGPLRSTITYGKKHDR
jgi:hypothetical protein